MPILNVTLSTRPDAAQSARIAAVFSAMQELLGELHEVRYIHVHDARAAAWRYSGLTQQFRAVRKQLS